VLFVIADFITIIIEDIKLGDIIHLSINSIIFYYQTIIKSD
jgi:hypothetical protein